MTDLLLNGARLHVAAPTGSGDPLILVHGGWTDHRTWSMLAPLLAQRHRVVAYDRRGHSLSDYGPGPSPRRRDEDDLAALIEALGAAPAHLVGSSYGASISLGLAGRRPELVRSVVAHEPPLTALAAQTAVDAQFASVQDQIAAGDVERGTRRFFEEVILGPGGWDLVPEYVRQASVANAQTFVDLREDPLAAALDVDAVRRFPGPLTITRGQVSPAWLQETAAATAAQLQRPLRVIPGAGHSPHLTTPQAFADPIAEAIGGESLRAAA